MGRVTATRALAALVVAAAAAAAIIVNLVLLGSASAENSPVGQLQPVKNAPANTLSTTNVPAAPQWTIRPTKVPDPKREHENDHNDD